MEKTTLAKRRQVMGYSWRSDPANEERWTTPVELGPEEWISRPVLARMVTILNVKATSWIDSKIFALIAELGEGRRTVMIDAKEIAREVDSHRDVVLRGLKRLKARKIIIQHSRNPLGTHYKVNRMDEWQLSLKVEETKKKTKPMTVNLPVHYVEEVQDLAKIRGVSVNEMLKPLLINYIHRERRKCQNQT